MKLAFLEDRPWIVWQIVEDIKKNYDLKEIMLIYYNNEENTESKKLKEVISKCKENNIPFKEIGRWNFDAEMNKLYDDKDRIFFFDLVLDDNVDYFEDRINVRYARNNKEDGRIWFYTTSGVYNVTNLANMFGEEQTIDVIDYDPEKNQIKFAEQSLNNILQDCKLLRDNRR